MCSPSRSTSRDSHRQLRSLAYLREALGTPSEPPEKAPESAGAGSAPPPAPERRCDAPAPRASQPKKAKAHQATASTKTRPGAKKPALSSTVVNADMFHTLNYLYQRAHYLEVRAALQGDTQLAAANASTMRQFFALAKRMVIRVYVERLTQ